MSDLDILREMIKDVAKLSLIDSFDFKKHVILNEPQQSNSQVIVCGIPDNTIVIKVDNFKSPDTIFNNLKGECKRADFVIITEANNKKFIIYIELKDTNKAQEYEIIQQLTGAKCFVAYCREIGRVFWNEQTFLKDYEERFVSIRHISIPKKKMRIIPTTGVHNSPDKVLKVHSSQHLELRHLIGRTR